MKTLRSISTAVLVFLVMAVPAASASTIKVAVSAPNFFLGTPVTYTVSGEAEVGQTFQVNIVSGSSETECYNQGPASVPVLKPVQVGRLHGSSVEPFNQSAIIPTTDYSALGTYTVCAMIRKGEHLEESLMTFAIMSEPAPVLFVPAAVVPSPAPVVTPAVTPHVATVVAPTATQKLHAALVKCKRQKNKHKRLKCERAAKTAAHR